MLIRFFTSFVLALACVMNARGEDFTLDDIEFWVGEGANEAALIIDWNGENADLDFAAPTLAWGYRWDDAATAEDALRDILAADSRLFGNLPNFGGLGVAVLGLGYDANDDGLFAIEPDPALELVPGDPGFDVTFDAATGLAQDNTETFASSIDPADAYEEGFSINEDNPDNEGFWHFSFSSTGLVDDFQTSGAGVSGFNLADGQLLGLAFADLFNFAAFPDNIVAAEPPSVVDSLPGDFNGDSQVDAADFTILRDTGGDAASFAVFQENFGASAISVTQGALTIPEPSTLGLLVLAAVCATVPSRNHS